MEFPRQAEGVSQKLTREQLLKEMLPHMKEAYEKAQRLLMNSAIQPDDFLHPYSEAVIQKDKQWVERMKSGQGAVDIHKMHADIIEAILFEHIEQSNWFGENVTTIKTSEFDDLRNGVDIIVEFEEGANKLMHMGLAVDVTFGVTAAQNKILKIRNEIQQGKLSEVKYFASERSPYKGLYQNLPRVVVGVDRLHLDELARMWTDPMRKREFATHPVQALILDEITQQMMSFAAFARKCGQEKIAETYERQLLLMRQIAPRISDGGMKMYQKQDSVGKNIIEQLQLFED